MGIKKTLTAFLLVGLFIVSADIDQVKAQTNIKPVGVYAQTAAAPDETELYGFTPIQELAVGRYVAYALLNRFDNKVNTSDDLNQYVNLLGQSIAKSVSKRPQISYKFGIIETDEINAFACPGGYIFVTTGLLKSLSDEGQLAAVLAHEIGHVEKGDGLKDIRDHQGDLYADYNVDKLASNVNAVYDMAAYTPYVGSYVSYYNPKNIAKREISKAIFSNIPGGYGGYVASSAANTAASAAVDLAGDALVIGAKKFGSFAVRRFYYTGLSPDVEYRADAFSVDSLAHVGYNPDSMAQFLNRLKMIEEITGQSTKQSGTSNVFSYTHPSTADRLARVKKTIQDSSFALQTPSSETGQVLKSRYKEKLNELK
jgi:predicted Zn-dependent protease